MIGVRGKRLKIVAVIFFVCWLILIAGVGLAWAYENKYHDKIYPDVMLGSLNLSGLSPEQVRDRVAQFRSDIERRGVTFVYKDRGVQIFPNVVAPEDPDLTYELINIDVDKTVDHIVQIGRSGSWWDNVKTKMVIFRKPYQAKLIFEVYRDQFQKTLWANFYDLEIPAKDAQIKVDSSLAVIIIPEESGVVPDYETPINQLISNVARLSLEEITLNSKNDSPRITASELRNKKQELEMLFANKENIILQYQAPDWTTAATWTINRAVYKDWLNVKRDQIVFVEDIKDYISQKIVPAVEVAVQESRFTMSENGKVSEFLPSSEGRMIDLPKLYAIINQSFFGDLEINDPIVIETKQVFPQYTTDSVNSLGIQEMIGVGKSNFAGSPANRRHNISIGAQALHGILVPPGEEFSLAQALGLIDETSGYLPELVIKGNKTIPEYGGGLCQIGTTLFRGALQSGLQITERRNHSYRVSYYEPAGTDCTIYPPHPDCRFKNDTTHHVLIQTYIKGDELFFEFWGTKDGRKVTVGEPSIFNITKPPPTKYVETEDLEVGEQKCTERAHNGAETVFDYKVEYPNGNVHKESFYSYYKPWQAVCLIGVEKAASGTAGLGQE